MDMHMINIIYLYYKIFATEQKRDPFLFYPLFAYTTYINYITYSYSYAYDDTKENSLFHISLFFFWVSVSVDTIKLFAFVVNIFNFHTI